jgi:hypothetical protein
MMGLPTSGDRGGRRFGCLFVAFNDAITSLSNFTALNPQELMIRSNGEGGALATLKAVFTQII